MYFSILSCVSIPFKCIFPFLWNMLADGMEFRKKHVFLKEVESVTFQNSAVIWLPKVTTACLVLHLFPQPFPFLVMEQRWRWSSSLNPCHILALPPASVASVMSSRGRSGSFYRNSTQALWGVLFPWFWSPHSLERGVLHAENTLSFLYLFPCIILQLPTLTLKFKNKKYCWGIIS